VRQLYYETSSACYETTILRCQRSEQFDVREFSEQDQRAFVERRLAGGIALGEDPASIRYVFRTDTQRNEPHASWHDGFRKLLLHHQFANINGDILPRNSTVDADLPYLAMAIPPGVPPLLVPPAS
jgi:hypothetical protein